MPPAPLYGADLLATASLIPKGGRRLFLVLHRPVKYYYATVGKPLCNVGGECPMSGQVHPHTV